MIRGWLLAFVLVALPWVGSAAAAPPADSFAEVHEVLAQCQAAYYRLVDYRGTLRHEVREGGATLRQHRRHVPQAGVSLPALANRAV